jgi:ABC-2 type transport system ATP-binding protein
MFAVKITDLTKRYAKGEEALKGIDLTVSAGDFFALLGPNGAGKSTTIGILSSLINKSSGSIEVFGYDLEKEPELAKSCIGLVPQEFNFNQFEPVDEILINQAGFYGIPRTEAKKRAEHYLKKLSLWDKRKAQARELSGGMKRRLMIARALVHNPKLLILDEPTAGVDIEIRRSMWSFLKEINQAGTTIILTTHYLEEAESLCRNIAIIDKGVIIENTSMTTMLRRLNQEVFVLDTEDAIDDLPTLQGFALTQVGESSFEVSVAKESGLNRLFSALNEAGITVLSMRNKQNRLEQLFIDMVGEKS